MKKAQKFRQSSIPRQQGERARLKVVKGSDYGSVFVLFGEQCALGRGEENDAVISDLKASRLHAEIKFTSEGWVIQDLGSSNGIMVSGQSVRKASLRDGSVFSVGETTLEFVSSDARTSLLMSPAKSVEQIQHEKQALQAQQDRIQRVTSFGQLDEIKAALFRSNGLPKRISPLLFVAVGLGVIVMFWDDKKKDLISHSGQKSNSEIAVRDLASYLPDNGVSSDSKKNAEIFFKSGFREFRERNFLRARQQFETALQIDPGHRLAKLYLENCDRETKEEVEFNLATGAKTFKAGRLQEAKGHFEAVLRLLYRDQSNPAFIEAMEQLKEVRKAIKDAG